MARKGARKTDSGENEREDAGSPDPTREEEPTDEQSGETDSPIGNVGGVDRSGLAQASAVGRDPSGTQDRSHSSGGGYVNYDRGSDPETLSARYGMDVRETQARELQRLEREFGRDRVSRWAEEGMPVGTMGKPQDMRAFRKRQDGRPDDVPTDIERRNEASRQRNAAGNRADGPAGETDAPDVVRRVVSSAGRSLDEPVQREMEAKMGGEFSDVQIHTGPKAAAAAESIDARAFTVGNHVAFNRGEYQPGTDDGKRVLAHELTHVRQQTGGAVSLLPQTDVDRPGASLTVGGGLHVQPKLEVSSPGDPAEREAERVADEVMQMSDTDAVADSGAAERIGRDETSDGSAVTGEAEEQIESIEGGGNPLPLAARSFYERRFGRGFGDVRIHTGQEADEAARSIEAEAFTHGTDIVFRESKYDPNGSGGRTLLAHELTHVVQQDGSGRNRIQRQGDGSESTNDSGAGGDTSSLESHHVSKDTLDSVSNELNVVETKSKLAWGHLQNINESALSAEKIAEKGDEHAAKNIDKVHELVDDMKEHAYLAVKSWKKVESKAGELEQELVDDVLGLDYNDSEKKQRKAEIEERTSAIKRNYKAIANEIVEAFDNLAVVCIQLLHASGDGWDIRLTPSMGETDTDTLINEVKQASAQDDQTTVTQVIDNQGLSENRDSIQELGRYILRLREAEVFVKPGWEGETPFGDGEKSGEGDGGEGDVSDELARLPEEQQAAAKKLAEAGVMPEQAFMSLLGTASNLETALGWTVDFAQLAPGINAGAVYSMGGATSFSVSLSGLAMAFGQMAAPAFLLVGSLASWASALSADKAFVSTVGGTYATMNIAYGAGLPPDLPSGEVDFSQEERTWNKAADRVKQEHKKKLQQHNAESLNLMITHHAIQNSKPNKAANTLYQSLVEEKMSGSFLGLDTLDISAEMARSATLSYPPHVTYPDN